MPRTSCISSRTISSRTHDPSSFLHPIPDIVRTILKDKPSVRTVWNTLTPLAKNEWICWITSAKKEETVQHRLDRFQTDVVMGGKRRPCCWPGCPHRGRKARFERLLKKPAGKPEFIGK